MSGLVSKIGSLTSTPVSNSTLVTLRQPTQPGYQNTIFKALADNKDIFLVSNPSTDKNATVCKITKSKVEELLRVIEKNRNVLPTKTDEITDMLKNTLAPGNTSNMVNLSRDQVNRFVTYMSFLNDAVTKSMNEVAAARLLGQTISGKMTTAWDEDELLFHELFDEHRKEIGEANQEIVTDLDVFGEGIALPDDVIISTFDDVKEQAIETVANNPSIVGLGETSEDTNEATTPEAVLPLGSNDMTTSETQDMDNAGSELEKFTDPRFLYGRLDDKPDIWGMIIAASKGARVVIEDEVTGVDQRIWIVKVPVQIDADFINQIRGKCLAEIDFNIENPKSKTVLNMIHAEPHHVQALIDEKADQYYLPLAQTYIRAEKVSDFISSMKSLWGVVKNKVIPNVDKAINIARIGTGIAGAALNSKTLIKASDILDTMQNGFGKVQEVAKRLSQSQKVGMKVANDRMVLGVTEGINAAYQLGKTELTGRIRRDNVTEARVEEAVKNSRSLNKKIVSKFMNQEVKMIKMQNLNRRVEMKRNVR